MRKMAKEIKISATSVRPIIKNGLGMSPFKIMKRQLLTDIQKEKRRERSKALLNHLKSGMDTGKIIFSDEKTFTIRSTIQYLK